MLIMCAKLLEPVSLVGCHLMVFRCYSSPWFSAIVTSHDLNTRVSSQLVMIMGYYWWLLGADGN